MFKSCFVARVAVEKIRSVELFCTFDDPQTLAAGPLDLPPAQALGGFCFPLGSDNVTPKEYMAPEEYSFTLTMGDGSRLHGFCRSFLPPRPAATLTRTSSSMRYPQVLCIISQHPWFSFYYKILQVTEQLLKQDNVLNTYNSKQLAPNHPASLFLTDLCYQCPQTPIPGRIIRVQYPKLDSPLSISPPKRIGWTEGADQLLSSSDQHIELEIPPDFGNGPWNAGIPLARLLWHVPVQGLMTLLAALLLERRVILVAQDRDKVSAAVHAAAALLYPFRWQHIYLPLLPIALKDYLTAPMPFLIGLQASLLPSLKQLPMDEVSLIDLDLGTCQPPPGSPTDDARHLPWADRLQAALQVVYDGLRSPTEFESTPVIAHVLQEYFLRLLGRYREFIQPEGTPQQPSATADDFTGPTLQRNSMSGRDGEIRARPSSKQSPKAATAGRAAPDDDGYLKGDGFQFDHQSFVESQGRNKNAQQFLRLFRHSQLYEVFINERLKLASQQYKTDDKFESKVAEACSRRAQSWSTFAKVGQAVQGSGSSVSNLSDLMHKGRNMVKTFAEKHRLTSEDGELFPSRESSFVRSSGNSFGGRSGSSFTGRLPSRTGPPNLQRFSGASVGLHSNDGHQHNSSPRDVNMVKAQINGIMHEDSLPFYDETPPQSASPSRQTSSTPANPQPLTRAHSHTPQASQLHAPSPKGRFSFAGNPSRLSTQGSSVDLGDLGISSSTGMSRASSKDSGHIASQGASPYASGSWQGRLSRSTGEQQQPAARHAQRVASRHGSDQQASAYSSIEAMLSSIPESLSLPSMPSIPSVPSMSEIERSMQSGWSSFTGSLGLAPATTPQAAAVTPSDWTAFAEVSNPTASQPASTANAVSSAPFTMAQQQPEASSSACVLGSSQQRGSVSGLSSGGQSPRSMQPPLPSPRRKSIGLQDIDPLAAAKEAANVPLRAMPSMRQSSQARTGSGPMAQLSADSTRAGSGPMGQFTSDAASASSSFSRSTEAHALPDGAPASGVDISPSHKWSDFADVTSASEQQGVSQSTQAQGAGATQQNSSPASTDLWAQWSLPVTAQGDSVSANDNKDKSDASHALAALSLSGQHSLLDL